MATMEERLRLAEAALTKNGFRKLDDIWVAQPKTNDALDAARYRWLAGMCKSMDEPYKGGWSIHIQGPVPRHHDEEDAFDAAIDAAMNAKGCTA